MASHSTETVCNPVNLKYRYQLERRTIGSDSYRETGDPSIVRYKNRFWLFPSTSGGYWWHAATMRISVNHRFERRIGIFPAGFDADGVLFCNTAYGDWPTRLPQGKWDPIHDPFAGWMLLSYRCETRASSAQADHPAKLAVDENIRTWWAATGEADEWLTLDLGEVCAVHALQLNFADHHVRRFGRDGDGLYHSYLVEGSTDGSAWQPLLDKRDSRDDLPHDYVQLDEPVECRHLRLTVTHVPGGEVAVSGFRVFGKAPGERPAAVESIQLERPGGDPLSLRISWEPIAGAVGYTVRWGVAPDKLYSSAIVYGDNALDLRCLDSRQRYYLAVEAFNRTGISTQSAVQGPI